VKLLENQHFRKIWLAKDREALGFISTDLKKIANYTSLVLTTILVTETYQRHKMTNLPESPKGKEDIKEL